jgi:hypothetical protein
MNRLRPAASFVAGEDHPLARLLEQAGQLERLTQGLAAGLPPPLGEHVQVGRFTRERLVLVTDSPAWATRLRYCAPDILRLVEELCGVRLKEVRVRVSPLDEPRAAPPPRGRPALSAASGELLRQAALATDDPKLQGALLRLSKRARQA